MSAWQIWASVFVWWGSGFVGSAFCARFLTGEWQEKRSDYIFFCFMGIGGLLTWPIAILWAICESLEKSK